MRGWLLGGIWFGTAFGFAACQTLTPGSGPGSDCGDKIEFSQDWTDELLTLRATNRCDLPICVRVDFPSLKNLERPPALPVEALLDPGEGASIVQLVRTEPGKRSPFTSRIELWPLHCRPQHDAGHRYAMPFGGEHARVLTQGVQGARTPQGELPHAFDFAMPVGTPVLAARAGYVMQVVDRHGPGGSDPALLNRANVVLVGHEDGSIAQYSHLSRDIRVRRGQRVDVGDELARSGNSGYSHGPQLHFAVSVLGSEGRYRSVPLRFVGGGADGLLPVEGQAYAPASSPASTPAAPE